MAKRRKAKPRLKASVRRAVLERDGHQCTYISDGRCPNTEDLEVHHVRYGKGDDIDSLTTFCRYHHHLIEAQLRPWNVNRLGRP